MHTPSAARTARKQHLDAMAGEVERRIDSIKTAAGPSGEARMLVMASLLMADDLYEMGRSLRARAAVGAAKAAQARRSQHPKLGRRLGKLAKRAEEIAPDLEHP